MEICSKVENYSFEDAASEFSVFTPFLFGVYDGAPRLLIFEMRHRRYPKVYGTQLDDDTPQSSVIRQN